VCQDFFHYDSTERLRSDLDSLLGDFSSLDVDCWSLVHDSSILSHLKPLPESVSDPPWIAHHLSVRRDQIPSFRTPGHLLCRLALLCSFWSCTALQPSQTLQFHHASSPPLLPSSLVQGLVRHSWCPLHWRTCRFLCRQTIRHEAIIDWLVQSSLLHSPLPDCTVVQDPSLHFVDSFDPAVAGMQLLLVESFDHFLQLAPPLPRAVSVDLRAPAPHHILSLIPESAFSLMVSDLDPPLIVDSGASCCISPCRDDSESYSPSSAKIKDLSGTNSVAGEGMIRCHVFDSSGRDFTISIRGYHIPTASIRLLSSQALYKSVGGHGEQDHQVFTCAS